MSYAADLAKDRDKYLQQRNKLASVLELAMPALRARATSEARANRAPTGLVPSSTHRDILKMAEGALAEIKRDRDKAAKVLKVK